MGGTEERRRCCFLKAQVPKAPKRVAMLPNTMSQGRHPVTKLLMRHPINRPGIAAGVNAGRIVKASEKRTWMEPLARFREAAKMVRAV